MNINDKTTLIHPALALLIALPAVALGCVDAQSSEAFDDQEMALAVDADELVEAQSDELEVAALDGVNLEDYDFIAELDELPKHGDSHSLDVNERWGLDLEDGVYMLYEDALYRYRGEVPSMPRFDLEDLSDPGELAPGELYGEAAERAAILADFQAPSAAPSPATAAGDPMEIEAPGLEQKPLVLLGSDNRTKVSTPNTWFPARSVGKLGAGCTATMIGPRHAITAAHCLSGGGSPSFAPGQNGDGVKPNGSYTATHVLLRVANSVLYDYGIIGLPDNATLASLGWMGFRWWNTMSTYNGKFVYLKGYPTSGSTCSGVSCAGFQWQHSGTINQNAQANGNYGVLYYPLDATGGQSGSSIYNYSSGVPAILGVHKRGNETPTATGGCGTCNYTNTPPDQNVGPRVTSTVYNDLCWMMSVVGPSSFASHPCTD